MNVSLLDQYKNPVEDMWEGFDRFCKVQEMNGRLANDLKEFEQTTEKKIS